MRRNITLTPYDNRWPERFAEEAEAIMETLGNNCIEIHHIGSTSIPGLAAKPIIDMVPVVKNLREVDNANEKMAALGYDVKGEFGFLMRRFFIKENEFHLHVFEKGNPEIDRYLKFRNWLKKNREDRLAYENLKHKLADEFKSDVQSYALAKNDFVDSIHQKAGSSPLRVLKALSEEEWAYAEAHALTQEKPLKHDDENCHLVLLFQTDLIGYAHIYMPPNAPPTIKCFVIDKPEHKTHEAYFQSIIKEWLQTKPLSPR